MAKKKVTNISAVGIIFKKSDSALLFLEKKDKSYPLKVFRHNLGLIGGNWIGKKAKRDKGPVDTLKREISEEISLKREIPTTLELKLLGLINKEKRYRVPGSRPPVTKTDLRRLREIKNAISNSIRPFGDFIVTTPEKLIRHGKTGSHRGDFINLCLAYLIPLNKTDWEKLKNLQRKFGNLSNESTTAIASLEKIARVKNKIAFGHDRILKDFYARLGQKPARKIRLNQNIKVKKLGQSAKSYRNYLRRFEVAKRTD